VRELIITCSDDVLEQNGVCSWVSDVEQNIDHFRIVLKSNQFKDQIMHECKYSDSAAANRMLSFMPARITVWQFC